MPSQGDYLDKLLEEMEENGELSEDSPDSGKEGGTSADAVSDMSEEEIQKLLAAGNSEDNHGNTPGRTEAQDKDVLDLLEGSGDEDLQEIQDLLQKSDNHENILDTSNGAFEESGDKAASRKQRALDRKRLRKEAAAEKKAAKREARMAKAAEKEAARIAKSAQKVDRREAAKPAKSNDAAEKGTSPYSRKQIQDGNDENLFDKELLDFIVSEAESHEKETAESESPEGEKSEMSSTKERTEAQALQTEESGEEELGAAGTDFDLDGVLEDTNVDVDLLAEDAADAGRPEMGEPPVSSDRMDEFVADAAADMQEQEGEAKEKSGFFSKVVNLLTEEDEDGEDQEETAAQSKPKKKPKKAKPKKEKKAKPAKAPKPPKPKKEKPPKEESEAPGKRLSFKKVLPVILVGISVGVLLFVFINASVEYVDKQTARTAFQAGDYKTCYENLFDKERNDSEEAMFGKAKSILYIQLWIREYEIYMAQGDQVRALDSLIRIVERYPELYQFAAAWNALTEVEAEYSVALLALSEQYGLTEADAREIAALSRDIDYTKTVTAIAQGQAYGNVDGEEAPGSEEESSSEGRPMEDQLPEEEELGGDTFIDNQ